MAENRIRSRIASALLGACVIVLGGLALWAAGIVRFRDAADVGEAHVQTPPVIPAIKPKAPALPLPEPPLDRRQLLLAFAAAADAAASGRAMPADNASLVGKSFAIRLPFGCAGPMKEDAKDWAGWTYNPKTKALKLTAQPEIWDSASWVHELAGELLFDAAEGFWIRRPWTSSQSCPKTANGEAAAAVPQARNTVGIVQFFAPGSSRTLRRGGRPYAVTVKAAQELTDAPRDYGLLLSGRIVGFPDGQPIHCFNEAANLVPVCLIAVEFDRVAFEDVAYGNVLSEWNS